LLWPWGAVFSRIVNCAVGTAENRNPDTECGVLADFFKNAYPEMQKSIIRWWPQSAVFHGFLNCAVGTAKVSPWWPHSAAFHGFLNCAVGTAEVIP